MAHYYGQRIYDNFSITDNEDNLVSGLKQSDFTYHLFDPSGNESSLLSDIIIEELGFGHYRVGFTPNKIGSWYLILYNEIYFPWGKSNSFDIERLPKNRIKP